MFRTRRPGTNRTGCWVTWLRFNRELNNGCIRTSFLLRLRASLTVETLGPRRPLLRSVSVSPSSPSQPDTSRARPHAHLPLLLCRHHLSSSPNPPKITSILSLPFPPPLFSSLATTATVMRLLLELANRRLPTIEGLRAIEDGGYGDFVPFPHPLIRGRFCH